MNFKLLAKLGHPIVLDIIHMSWKSEIFQNIIYPSTTHPLQNLPIPPPYFLILTLRIMVSEPKHNGSNSRTMSCSDSVCQKMSEFCWGFLISKQDSFVESKNRSNILRKSTLPQIRWRHLLIVISTLFWISFQSRFLIEKKMSKNDM